MTYIMYVILKDVNGCRRLAELRNFPVESKANLTVLKKIHKCVK
jgi:hypothetical protein